MASLLLVAASSPAIPTSRTGPVAVLGAGGRLGTLLYGTLQRVAQDQRNNLEPPIGLCGTTKGARGLSKGLYRQFGMAFAPEQSIRFVDFADAASVARSLTGCSALLLEAAPRLEHVPPPPSWLRPFSLTPTHDFETFMEGGAAALSTAPAGFDVVHILEAALEAAAAANVERVALLTTQPLGTP
eukprot:4747701-Prymnesium_polylepis.1